jgi:protein O-mannosyl-transferase
MPDESSPKPSGDRKGGWRGRRSVPERTAANVRERRPIEHKRDRRSPVSSQRNRPTTPPPKEKLDIASTPADGPDAVLNADAVPHRLSAKEWLAAALLVAATLALYWPAVHAEFVKWDDDVYVSDNDHVTSGLLPGNIAWAWTTTDGSNWHPLTWLSLQLDASLFGPGPFGFHLDNIVQHALSAAVLFWFLCRLTAAPVPSFAVAALFAWHPLHVESVAWVSERKDTLSTLFWFLTLGAYVGYAHAPSRWRYLPVAALFGLGLLSKPMLVTVPVVLLLLDYWPLARLKMSPGRASESRETMRPNAAGLTLAQAVLEKIPLFAIAAAASVGAIFAQRASGALKSLTNLSLTERVALSVMAYVDYLRQMVWPFALACRYPIVEHSLFDPLVGLALGFLIVATLVAVSVRRSRPYVIVGWLWYLVTLVPVIGLVAVGDQARADRYTYVPLTGIFLIIAWGMYDFSRRFPALRSVVVGLWLCVFAFSWQLTREQIEHWQSNVKLWEHCATLYPSVKSLENVLLAYGVEHLEHNELDRAAEFFQKLVTANPNDGIANYHLGLVSDRKGNLKQAERYYSTTIRLMPAYWRAHINLAFDLLRRGDLQEARAHLETAQRLHPGRAAVERGLGDICAAEGRMDDAVHHWQAARRIQPNDPEVLARLNPRGNSPAYGAP